MKEDKSQPIFTVKVYHGYGHKNNLVVFGHELTGKPIKHRNYNNTRWGNILHLFKLFFVKPVAGARVQLLWKQQQCFGTTEKDGFYKFEWESFSTAEAGWHTVTVNMLHADGSIAASGCGKVFVPHVTQFAFISDIDDTVLVSYSATSGKRIKELFTKNPHTRKAFNDVVNHYHLLSVTHTTIDVPNPFFYVSSSEWNLYDDLVEFFKHNKLPEGAFLLSGIKKWHQLLKTGKTKHEGKLIRVVRILEAFPQQRFVLMGDNSQRDPDIYAAIANKYPDRIEAVYIRNIKLKHAASTETILAGITNKNIYTFLFDTNEQAIRHSRSIGLIN